MKTNNPETLCIHAGEDRHGLAAGLATDVAHSSVFAFPTVADLRRYNQGKSNAYIYTRYANPTTRVAEEKIAALEGAEDCLVTSSGMAAVLCAVLAVCKAGDEIVSMLDIYGGTLKLFEGALAQCGITTKFVPYHDLRRVERYFSRRTRLLFLESPTNPTLRCANIAELSTKAKKRGISVVFDNTFATPLLQKALPLGADMVIHSATKYLGGHSDLTAGAVCGPKRLIDAARAVNKSTGGTLDPAAAYLLIRGLKTLHLRVERACENAEIVALALRQHPKVDRVMYPGLPEHDDHDMNARQMTSGGMMVAFEIAGGGRAAERFIDRLKLWYLAPSLGGVESTVSYPVEASHVGLKKDVLALLGVTPAAIRLSVGIEHAADLVEDLEQALG